MINCFLSLLYLAAALALSPLLVVIALPALWVQIVRQAIRIAKGETDGQIKRRRERIRIYQ